MVDHPASPLSEPARSRMAAELPGLLAAVRRRRRRRHLARGAAVVLALAGGLALWQFTGRDGVAPAPLEVRTWTTVRDDLRIVARVAVPTIRREEWFVDDAGLQELLRGDERPEGLVRVRGQVLVSAAAVDPFPTLLP